MRYWASSLAPSSFAWCSTRATPSETPTPEVRLPRHNPWFHVLTNGLTFTASRTSMYQSYEQVPLDPERDSSPQLRRRYVASFEPP
jgi:hypothetical protein